MSIEAALTGRTPTISRPPVTARIVRTDMTGVWAVPLGGDNRFPIGPCKGSPGAVGGAVGAVVIVYFTDAGPWIVQSDEDGVDSVNGQVGVVVLDAADVGAATPGDVAAASLEDRARANHTGTQPSSTISDFDEAAQDAVAAMLAASTGVTLAYDDAANTLTITGLGDPETMRDTIGAALLGTGLITVTVNDAADTITIATTATQNSTDAVLKNRANHTGTQPAETVTGIAAAVLLTSTSYAAADKATSSAALDDFDALNLSVTFAAPATGKVLVRLTGVLSNSMPATNRWGLREGAATVKEALVETAATDGRAVSVVLPITGLTPGQAHTYKWAGRTTLGTLNLLAATGGAAGMEVWSA